MDLTMTTPASTIAWQSAGCVHSTMHAELVPVHLVFVTTDALHLRADFRMLLRVRADVAVDALREAVHGFSDDIDVGLVTLEAPRRLGASCRSW